MLFGLMTMVGVASLPLATYAQGWGAGTQSNLNRDFGDLSGGPQNDIRTPGTDQDTEDSLITVINRFINYLLGFLGLIALIMLLVGGFFVLTAGADDGAYKKGLGYMKNAGIGIAIIGLAWFVVSFIFFIFTTVTGA